MSEINEIKSITVNNKKYDSFVDLTARQHSSGSGGLTTAQVTALDGMFKIASFNADPTGAYSAFKTAFGLDASGGGDTGEDTGGNDNPGGDETHTHSYTSSVVTTEAACTKTGVRTYTCSCGHSYTETIPATGHNYDDGVCTKCGATDPNYEDVPEEPDVPSDTTEPVYQLMEATTFNADKVIDTGYKLLDKEKSWSVCVDYTDTERGGVVWDASPNGSQGLALSHRGGYTRTLYLAGSLYKEIGNTVGNHKVVVTHMKGAEKVDYYIVPPGADTFSTGEITYTKYLTDPNIVNQNPLTVKIGGNYSGTASYKGTVNRFEIYERVLSVDEISEFTGASQPGEVEYVTTPCTLQTDDILPGYIGDGGGVVDLANAYIANMFIKVSPGGAYNVNASDLYLVQQGNVTARYAWFDSNGVFIQRGSYQLSTAEKTINITAPATAAYVKFGISGPPVTESTVSEYLGYISISEVSA